MPDNDMRSSDSGIATHLSASRRSVLAAAGVAGLGLGSSIAAGDRSAEATDPYANLEDAEELPPLFDCDAWVGETDVNPVSHRLHRPDPELDEEFPGYSDEPEDLLADMDRVGVDRALVYHVTARTEDAKAGNERTMDAVEDHPRLEPSWVVTPDAVDEYGGPEAFVDAMEAAGVGAVRMFPGEWTFMYPDEEEKDWHLMDDEMEPVYEALAEVNAIVMFDALTAIPWGAGGWSWNDVGEFCETYQAASDDEPGLSVIVTQLYPGLPSDGVLDVVDSVENLYVDTARFQEFQGIRPFVDEIGLDRMVFGTNAPHASAGASLWTLMRSRLSSEEQRRIGWENLADLLEQSPSGLAGGRGRGGRGNSGNTGSEAGQGGVIDPGNSDGKGRAFGAEETNLKTLPYNFVDLHAHVRAAESDLSNYPDADAVIEEFDRTGIDLAVTHTGGGPSGNDETYEAAQRYPDRLIPGAFASPFAYPTEGVESVREELERCFDELGMRIIKISPRVAVDHEAYHDVYEFANERGALLTPHVGEIDEAETQAWMDIASSYPDMTLMLYHAGRNWAAVDNFARIVEHSDNVLLEVTFSYNVDGIIAHLVDRVGTEKVFFGTDVGFRAPQSQVGWGVYDPLDPDDQRRVMRDNGLELLDDLGVLPETYRDEV